MINGNQPKKKKKKINNTKQNKKPNLYLEKPSKEKTMVHKIFHCQIMSLQQYSLLGKTRRHYGNISTEILSL